MVSLSYQHHTLQSLLSQLGGDEKRERTEVTVDKGVVERRLFTELSVTWCKHQLTWTPVMSQHTLGELMGQTAWLWESNIQRELNILVCKNDRLKSVVIFFPFLESTEVKLFYLLRTINESTGELSWEEVKRWRGRVQELKMTLLKLSEAAEKLQHH